MKSTITPIIILITLVTISTLNIKAQVGEPPKGAISTMKTEEFSYTNEGFTQKGYVAYVPNEKQKLPVVLIVPEWWGYGEYVKMRARKLAELGYFAMVVDMFGEGKEAKSVEEAQKFSGEFYQNPMLGRLRLEAAERHVRTFQQADGGRISAIGYCFGGSMVLNAAKQGMDFKGVVSFHGGLKGVPAAKGVVRGKILVCHGGADKFVSDADVQEFKRNLDSVGVRYGFKVYANATHAFTNPEADANAKKFNLPIAYNAEADKQSWQDMRIFLRDVFYKK